MDEETFNIELRKFLKHFGVTAQREIERTVSEGLADGTLKGSETLQVRATLTIPGRVDGFHIDGQIHLAPRAAER